MHYNSKVYNINKYKYLNEEPEEQYHIKYGSNLNTEVSLNIYNHENTILESLTKQNIFEVIKNQKEGDDMEVDEEVVPNKIRDSFELNNLEKVNPLVVKTASELKYQAFRLHRKLEMYLPLIDCCPIEFR